MIRLLDLGFGLLFWRYFSKGDLLRTGITIIRRNHRSRFFLQYQVQIARQVNRHSLFQVGLLILNEGSVVEFCLGQRGGVQEVAAI